MLQKVKKTLYSFREKRKKESVGTKAAAKKTVRMNKKRLPLLGDRLDGLLIQLAVRYLLVDQVGGITHFFGLEPIFECALFVA